MQTLEDKAELLDLLLEATNDGVVYWDLLESRTRYNDRWRYLLGWDEEGFMLAPDTWRELIHEDERAAVETALTEHLESSWPFIQVVKMRHRTLGWRWILMRGKASFTAQGQPSRMVILFTDINERMRAEAQVHALIQGIPDTILNVRTDGTILAAKGGNRSSSALPRPGAAQALFDAIQASEAGPRVLECIEAAGRRDEVVQIPCRLHQAGSDPTDYEIRIMRSGVDQAVCIVRDVTRERSNEEQLARARKLEAIGQLAAGLAHEINTPLQYIGDNLEFAKESLTSLLSLIDDFHRLAVERLPAEAIAPILRREQEIDLSDLRESLAPALSRGLEGLASITRIVRAMRTFETAGRQERIRVDLNPILKNAAIVATRGWSEFVNVLTNLDDRLPPVPCIPGEIAQVVMNLVINSAQSIADKVGTSGDKGQIAIETLYRPDDELVEIRVKDDGLGIPEAIRGRVFDPFFTTRPPGQGAGQGLAQVHAAVVRQHGGSVDFDSVEGKGTTFVVRLPMRIIEGKDSTRGPCPIEADGT
jgi:PAS domain S-box-containing protein